MALPELQEGNMAARLNQIRLAHDIRLHFTPQQSILQSYQSERSKSQEVRKEMRKTCKSLPSGR